MAKLTIWAVPDDDGATKAAVPGLGGMGGPRGKAEEALELIELEPGQLRARLEVFLSEFSQMDRVPDGHFSVDEIELSLTVNAKGGVALIGKLEAGAEAGIKVKIRRQGHIRS